MADQDSFFFFHYVLVAIHRLDLCTLNQMCVRGERLVKKKKEKKTPTNCKYF